MARWWPARCRGRLLGLYDSAYDSTDPGSVADGTAVTQLFLTLGVVYFVVMMFGAFTVRVPADDWTPDGWDPSQVKAKSMVTTASVSAANAIRTPQFWLLWVVLFCNVTAGIGILEQAGPMIQDFFREGAASSVTAAAAGGFVGLLSLFNMAGRFVWSSTSDVIGRKPIYMLYLGVGMVLYLLLALVGNVRDRAVRAARRDHPVVLRRRVRHHPGVPARPVRHLPGRRHPRPAADRLVGRRRRRPADRQRRSSTPRASPGS